MRFEIKMKLEDQFFHSFFYPFLLGVILSTVIFLSSSIIFTNNRIDKLTGNYMVELGKEYSKINFNSVNEIKCQTKFIEV